MGRSVGARKKISMDDAGMKIAVVIPTLNEEKAIGEVVGAIPRDLVHEIIVADNGSTDGTVARAKASGAKVIHERRRGYGAACLAGAKAAQEADIVVFLDGDYSDDPRQLPMVAVPVIQGSADLVIGSRLEGFLHKGSMPWHGRLGNRIIVLSLRWLYGVRITDLGSFRAIRAKTLADLHMQEMTYGWPVEMVVKAAKKGWRIHSVPISHRRRLGKSKVTGTLTGSIMAAYYMFLVPLRYLWKE
jgi:glycosyltransferase involved in cell wall biosynthesis